jgi:N6-L-threonylcarbamoyladenine synthase
MLALGYPGGPVVDRRAANGRADAVSLPRPDPGGLNWSFSGLKTAVRTHLQRHPDTDPADLCASFQAAVVDCLVDRVQRAATQTGVTRVGVAGGVAANSGLRARLAACDGLQVTLPPRSRCTDNAAMIAHAGRMRLLTGERDALDLGARSRWQPGAEP